jgi:uncharacterized protein (TIGR00661 family)
MKILIGICGIGYGHSVRQSLVIEKLIQRGARVAVFCFGKSLELMTHHNPHHIPFREVCVPWIYTNRNGIDWEKTEARNLKDLRRKNYLSIQAFKAVPEIFNGRPDACISDYEPVSAAYAYQHDIPLITIDQQSKFLGYHTEDIMGYSRIEERSRLGYFFPYAEARYAVSFYPVRAEPDKDYVVEIIPAPVRKEIQDMLNQREYSLNNSGSNSNKVLVYFSPYGPLRQSIQEIIRVLAKFKELQFIVYNNFFDGSANLLANAKHISFEPFDMYSFAHNLISANCLISTAGHTLVSEAAYLSIPVYTIPLSTYDQHYCTKIIDQYQVGMNSTEITESQLEKFFSNLPVFKKKFTENTKFTVESEISESLIDRIWDIASSHSGKKKSSVHNSSLQTNQNFNTSNSSLIKDKLFNPKFDELLTPPLLPHKIDYKDAVIKPTMKCVCNCTSCQARSKDWWNADTQSMTLQQWQEVFPRLKDCGFERVQISGGEPLLYSHLPQMIESIRNNGLEALLNTNGFLLSSARMKALCESGLNGINFSLDSPKPSIHDFLRNRQGIWKRCLDGIKLARKYNDYLWCAVRMVLTSFNLMDLPEMLKLAIDLEVSSLKLSYLEWNHQGSPLLPNIETLQRFKDVVLPCCQDILWSLDIQPKQKEITGYILKHLLYPGETNSLEHYARGIYWNNKEYTKHCKIPYSLIIIYGDGRILPCNASEYARISLPGNLHKDTLENILYSKTMEDFRRNMPDFCWYCPMILHVTLPLRDTIV